VTTDGSYLYLTDTGGKEFDRYTLAGDYLSSFFVYSETVFPEGITYNPETGNLYVVDGVDFEPPEIVAEYSISGTLSTTYNLPSTAANGLAYDPLRCTYWTYDSADDSVEHLSPSFTLIESFPGTQAAGFASGEGVAVINNTLYVATKNDNTIVAFDISAADTTYASLCTVDGTLTGQVTSANTGLGLPDVTIVATDGVFTYSVFSDASGFYTLTLPAGSYTVTASLSGYNPVTELDVQIFPGATILNIALPAGGLTATPSSRSTGNGVSELCWEKPLFL
jgi:sugar lactone lactonase YvrE